MNLIENDDQQILQSNQEDIKTLTSKAVTLIRLGQLEEVFRVIDDLEILVYIDKYQLD